jgi:mono/diheme cytochrome c family protein
MSNEMRRTKDLEDSVKNQVNKLMTFRAFSIGFSTCVLALACGGDSGSDNNADPATPPNATPAPVGDIVPAAPQRETCDDNPTLAECAPAAAPTPAAPGAAPAAAPGPEELARAQATNILASNCGQCHGPALTPVQASAGMNYIQDMDQLAATGKLIPGNSNGSRIIQRMREGSMPPLTSGKPKVSDQEIDVVAQFIDNPRFWPDSKFTVEDCSDQLFDYDSLYQEVARDLAIQDNDDALTTRYITLTNRFTAGVCADTTLDKDRQALFKMVNALSIDTVVRTPEPVDADETIYRIDLADYGWDEPVTVIDAAGNAVDFADRWEAIAANNPYAVPFVGDDADDAVADSGTAFPVMLADSMLDTAIIGNLYYALINVNVQDTLDNFILNDLQIDVAQNLLDEEQVRAGTTKSRISRQDRVVQRDEIEIRQGVLWQSFDFEDDQNQSIFDDPFGFAEGGTEAIFTLPNGLFGFIIADADSNIVEDSDILLDTNQNNFRAVTSVSCSNCHAQGLIPVVDEVREIALANARTSGLNNDEVEQLRAVYPPASEFAQIVDDDSTQFFKASLNRASVPLQGGDPLSTVFFRFDQDMRLADAAGDLGLPAQELADNLNLLNPALGVLDQGSLDRDDFTQFYVDSLCKLQIFGDNAPDPVLCADVDANGGIVP